VLEVLFHLCRWFAVGIHALLSVACGGGGGSSNETDDNGGNTDDTTDDVHPFLQNVNGTLPGVYFSTTALNEGE
jgi:hypothetical protein